MRISRGWNVCRSIESSIGSSCMRSSIIVRLCGGTGHCHIKEARRAYQLWLAGGPDIKNMKFYVRTYGCQMNVADSNEMGRHLKAKGLVETQDPDDASIFLVNTCTVRQHAEDRAFSEIGRLKRWKARQAGRKLVITGCAAERTKEFLDDRFPHIDLVVGAKSIENFAELVERMMER